MKFGSIDVKPVGLYLPDDEKFRTDAINAKKYFAEQGIEDILWTCGFYAEKLGLKGTLTYPFDGVQDPPYYIGIKYLGGYLSVLQEWAICKELPYTHFMFLENDCRFIDGWKEILSQAILDAEEIDWDIFFVGYCCIKGTEPTHVKGNVYSFPYRGKDKWNFYPQAMHCYIVNKRCLEYLISTNRTIDSPIDVSLISRSFPALKVVAVVPRIAEQENTFLPP